MQPASVNGLGDLRLAAALENADGAERDDDRERAEQDRAERDRRKHRLRPAVARGKRRERDRPERRPAPVEGGREQRETEIVEGGIRNEQQADEEPHGPADQAEKGEEAGAGAGRVEGEDQQVPKGGEQEPHGPHVAALSAGATSTMRLPGSVRLC